MQIELVIDPTGFYENNAGPDWQQRVIDALGILPAFLTGPHESLADNMQDNYQFFHAWTSAADHDVRISNDCFIFPGDPPQYPLGMATQGDETIHFYPNCIVTVSTEGDLLKWTRMD